MTIGELLQTLVNENLVTARQIAQLTGRGESTVYRWLAGQSVPDFTDVAELTRSLPCAEARQRLVDLFVNGLPVVVEWIDLQPPVHPAAKLHDQATNRLIRATRDLAAALDLQRDLARRNDSPQGAQAGELIAGLNHVVRMLIATRNLYESAPAPGRAAPRRQGGQSSLASGQADTRRARSVF